jgi:hypothetical protein
MQEILEKLKNLNTKFVWPFRIIVSLTMFFAVSKLSCDDHYYPEITFGFVLISVFAHSFKQNIIAIGILLFDVFIIYAHQPNY